MRKLTALLFIPLILSSSCASIFKGSTEDIQFDSNVEGAIVEMDGIEVGRTPYTMKVKKSFKGTMTMRADGYKDKNFKLQKSFDTFSLLNLLNGTVGWIVDLITGAVNKFDQEKYTLTLDKED